MNKRRMINPGLAAVLIVLMLLSGCAGAPTPTPTVTPTMPPTNTPTPAPTSTPTQIPMPTPIPLIVDSWQMSITQAENADLAGGWEFVFLDNGRFIVTWKGREAALGAYTLKNEQLAITDEIRAEHVQWGAGQSRLPLDCRKRQPEIDGGG